MSKAQLIISQPGQRTRRVEITKKLVSIGRKTDNTVALEGDTNVSKYHAVIELRPDGFWLSDLGSSNGTTVNRRPVKTELKLTNGDLICVGGTSTVEFVLPEGATPDPPDADEPTAAAPPPPEPATPAPPPTATPAPAKQSSGASPMLIAGIVGGVVVVGALVALLFATGAIGGSGAKKSSSDNANAASSSRPSNTTAADEFGGGDTSGDNTNSGGGDPSSLNNPSASNSTEDTTGASSGAPALPSSTQGADASAVGPLARTLAAQIGQKSVYSFDPAFVNLIQNYTNEYRTAAGYSERARKYRDAVEQEFVNVQGIQPPLIGYVMGMSRSKFNERAPGGVWGLPASASNADAGDPADPAAATRAAAAYMKELLDLFGRDQFMYAVACYGMTLDEAGKVKTDLESKDTTGQMRYDFWKMKNAGVVRGEQVERVARFFAAGIVGENPQAFGLKDKPLSSLYDL